MATTQFHAVFSQTPSFRFAGMQVQGDDRWIAVFVGGFEERTIISEATANTRYQVRPAKVTPA